jgi:F0F1-type ATP synthase membrane subunit b/b'
VTRLSRCGTARAETDRAGGVRQEAETYLASARTQAEEQGRNIVSEAEREAIGIKDAARIQVNAELAERQVSIDNEVRQAMAAIEKMQTAVNAELEAQQMYTEALRFRAASPTRAEADPETQTAPTPATPRRRAARKPRTTA